MNETDTIKERYILYKQALEDFQICKGEPAKQSNIRRLRHILKPVSMIQEKQIALAKRKADLDFIIGNQIGTYQTLYVDVIANSSHFTRVHFLYPIPDLPNENYIATYQSGFIGARVNMAPVDGLKPPTLSLRKSDHPLLNLPLAYKVRVFDNLTSSDFTHRTVSLLTHIQILDKSCLKD